MSVVVNQTIGGGFSTLYKQNNTNRFNKGVHVVSKKREKFSRFERNFIKDESYLASCRVLWDLLSEEEKELWRSAGDYTDLEGYNLFVQDTTYRLKNSIPGVATPSNYYQYKVGHLSIPEGSGSVLLRQSGGYTLSGRIEIHTWFKTAVTADGSSPNTLILRFRYYRLVDDVLEPVVIEYSYPLSTDWTSNHTYNDVVDNASGGWEFEIEAVNVKGDFWFDNTYAYDLGDVFTRDRYCNRCEKFWHGLVLPAGVVIESTYLV